MICLSTLRYIIHHIVFEIVSQSFAIRIDIMLVKLPVSKANLT